MDMMVVVVVTVRVRVTVTIRMMMMMMMMMMIVSCDHNAADDDSVGISKAGTRLLLTSRFGRIEKGIGRYYILYIYTVCVWIKEMYTCGVPLAMVGFASHTRVSRNHGEIWFPAIDLAICSLVYLFIFSEYPSIYLPN